MCALHAIPTAMPIPVVLALSLMSACVLAIRGVSGYVMAASNG